MEEEIEIKEEEDCTTVVIKVEEENKGVLVNLSIPFSYPLVPPVTSLRAQPGCRIFPEAVEQVMHQIQELTEGILGTPMIFSIVSIVRENFELLLDQTSCRFEGESLWNQVRTTSTLEQKNSDQIVQVVKEREDKSRKHMTKAAKRREQNRLDAQGEFPRGWNWVDLISHVSNFWFMSFIIIILIFFLFIPHNLAFKGRTTSMNKNNLRIFKWHYLIIHANY